MYHCNSVGALVFERPNLGARIWRVGKVLHLRRVVVKEETGARSSLAMYLVFTPAIWSTLLALATANVFPSLSQDSCIGRWTIRPFSEEWIRFQSLG